VTVLLGLLDALIVGGPRLVFAPEMREYVAQTSICIALVVAVD
jgi:hypothetical protein